MSKKNRIEMTRRLLKEKEGFMPADLIRYGIILVIAFCTITLIYLTSGSNLKSNTAEQMLLDRMIFNSISGFTYVDSNGRAHPGVVDLERFNQERIDSAITLPGRAGVKIRISSLDGQIVREIHINQEYSSMAGAQTTNYVTRKASEPIIIRTAKGDIDGILEAHYVFRKR